MTGGKLGGRPGTSAVVSLASEDERPSPHTDSRISFSETTCHEGMGLDDYSDRTGIQDADDEEFRASTPVKNHPAFPPVRPVEQARCAMFRDGKSGEPKAVRAGDPGRQRGVRLFSIVVQSVVWRRRRSSVPRTLRASTPHRTDSYQQLLLRDRVN